MTILGQSEKFWKKCTEKNVKPKIFFWGGMFWVCGIIFFLGVHFWNIPSDLQSA
jgi:hypothetical protein